MAEASGRVAVVTGASSGIGAAIAYQLQDAGFDVVALARRKDAIAGAVAGARQSAEGRRRGGVKGAGPGAARGALHCLACDVSDEADVAAAFRWVQAHTAGVRLLVNNAGVGPPHSLAGATDASTAAWKAILDVNVLGLSVATREALQQMKENGVDDGHIVHISSVAGHMNPQEMLPMYFASKHAVRVLTEGLRKELVAAKSAIRVTEVSPGMVDTGFFEANKIAMDIKSVPSLHSEDVADAVLYAVSAPAHVQIHEIIIKPVGEQF